MSTPVPDPIRLGTRASVLARTQSATVGDALASLAGRPWSEVLIRTRGDDTTKPLDQPGSPGLFVSTLRQALLEGEVDVVVHSFKDLPSAPEPGIVVAAVPERVDARDVLVSRDGLRLADLPSGAVVGTSSPRRSAAIATVRPDLVIRPIRGNVDTRIRKVRDGEYDATVLAAAGLQRIGRLDEIAEYLDGMIPAPGQGALAVECRADDLEMRDLLAGLDDAHARLVTTAERQVLIGIHAACTTAVAAHATYDDGSLVLCADLAIDGATTASRVVASCAVDDTSAARTAGMRAAAHLVSAGERPLALLVRSAGNGEDIAALGAVGVAAVCEAYVQSIPVPGDSVVLMHRVRESLERGDSARTWIVATSALAMPSWVAGAGNELPSLLRAAARAGMRAAATGERSARTLVEAGFGDVLVPPRASAADLVAAMSELAPGYAIFPHGDRALWTLPEGLAQSGWRVDAGVVYATSTVDERPASADLVEDGTVGVLVLRAPSAARAVASHARVPDGVIVVCTGETTAREARESGLTVSAVSQSPSPSDVAAAVSAAIASPHRR